MHLRSLLRHSSTLCFRIYRRKSSCCGLYVRAGQSYPCTPLTLTRDCHSHCHQLEAKTDAYNGIIITENLSGMLVSDFRSRLAHSIQSWREMKRRGVWLRIPIESSELIPAAVDNGFWFHHSSSNYLLMCTWLPGGKEQSRLPAAASHYIAAAGFVLNSNLDLLVIQEQTGPAAGIDLWKLPGGYCSLGEDISAGVVREVKEETGIDCTFQSLVAMVEGHKGNSPARESASDLYCVSILRPVDETQPIVPQEGEVAACKWIPMSTVLKHPLYAPDTAFGQCFRTAYSVSTNASTRDTGGLISKTFPLGIGKRRANVMFVNAAYET